MSVKWKNISVLILLFCCSLKLNSSADHAIYISIMEVNYKSQSLTIKTFSDDLLNALKVTDPTITLSTDPCSLVSSLETYIETYLTMYINNEEVELTFHDCQIESDTHWINLKYVSELRLTAMKIETHWLTDLFLNQQNIIKVNVGDHRQNARLNADKTSFELEF